MSYSGYYVRLWSGKREFDSPLLPFKKMEEIDFQKMSGLIPAIVQDFNSQQVLMLGFMNKESYKKTKETGKVTFWSRTRNKLWTKGETSGNFLLVKEMFLDCDNDTLLIKAEAIGPTCHTGNKTCFFKEIK